jgi:hypothetical protein
MNLLNKLVSSFRKPEIYPEALRAYYFRLPDSIEVDWKKEDGFIVGEIKDDKNNVFYTQGKDPKDFVMMVNDAIYTAYGIKKEYKAPLSSTDKYYMPNTEAWAKLSDGTINRDVLHVKKGSLQLA